MRPTDVHYTKEHEWIRLEGGEGTVGITDYAARELGDIVFIELPEVGRTLEAGESFGTIETVKSVEELYAPVSGTVSEVNLAATDTPEQVNEDPYGEGWLIKLDEIDTGSAELMSAEDYGKEIGED